MTSDKRISDAELDLMEVLWAASEPLTSAEIVERLEAHRDWSSATVKTMLGRLVAKGVLTHREDGRRFLYCTVNTISFAGSLSGKRSVDMTVFQVPPNRPAVP